MQMKNKKSKSVEESNFKIRNVHKDWFGAFKGLKQFTKKDRLKSDYDRTTF